MAATWPTMAGQVAWTKYFGTDPKTFTNVDFPNSGGREDHPFSSYRKMVEYITSSGLITQIYQMWK